jgi:hypothetical protein
LAAAAAVSGGGGRSSSSSSSKRKKEKEKGGKNRVGSRKETRTNEQRRPPLLLPPPPRVEITARHWLRCCSYYIGWISLFPTLVIRLQVEALYERKYEIYSILIEEEFAFKGGAGIEREIQRNYYYCCVTRNV